jgi:hypothetical protein
VGDRCSLNNAKSGCKGSSKPYQECRVYGGFADPTLDPTLKSDFKKIKNDWVIGADCLFSFLFLYKSVGCVGCVG